MKRIIVFGYVIIISCVVFIGCFKGYIGKDGAMLKKYLEPEKLNELVEKPVPSIWIIDVRPESAYVKGHIGTAKNFPSSNVLERLNEIPKSQYLIVGCETGGRAQGVIKKLEKLGYTRLMNWGANSRYFKKYGKVAGKK